MGGTCEEGFETMREAVICEPLRTPVGRYGGVFRDVPAAELAGLMETAHLLRSPHNARRLLTALRRAQKGKGKPATIEQLRRGIGIAPAR